MKPGHKCPDCGTTENITATGYCPDCQRKRNKVTNKWNNALTAICQALTAMTGPEWEDPKNKDLRKHTRAYVRAHNDWNGEDWVPKSNVVQEPVKQRRMLREDVPGDVPQFRELPDDYDAGTREIRVRGYSQDTFKYNMGQIERTCRLSCGPVPAYHEAAHIRPNARCPEMRDKISGYNGLWLSPSAHRLFDAGLFTFRSDGQIVHASWSTSDIRLAYGLPELIAEPEPFLPEQLEYLQWHHTNIFKETVNDTRH